MNAIDLDDLWIKFSSNDRNSSFSTTNSERWCCDSKMWMSFVRHLNKYRRPILMMYYATLNKSNSNSCQYSEFASNFAFMVMFWTLATRARKLTCVYHMLWNCSLSFVLIRKPTAKCFVQWINLNKTQTCSVASGCTLPVISIAALNRLEVFIAVVPNQITTKMSNNFWKKAIR